MMKKVLNWLAVAKDWIVKGSKWLGRLLGVVKAVEEEIKEQEQEEEAKATEK